MRVALATAVSTAGLDEDQPLLLSALAALGIDAEPAPWDDPAVKWSAFDLVLVRSTWNYAPRRDEFVRWADRVAAATRTVNPAPVLWWNTDKRYLLDLQRAGVPTVPTRFVGPGDPVEIPFDGEVVIKPAVGAGSIDAARHDAADQAVNHVRRLNGEGRVAMVQPYLRGIDDAGETGLVYLAGEYSHAIRKGAILRNPEFVRGLYAREDIGPREPSTAERRVAKAALAAAPGPLLYARVDVAPGPDGAPCVLELEATEPSLFLAYGAGAADRLARAVRSAAEV